MTIGPSPHPGDYAPVHQTYVDAAAAGRRRAWRILDGQQALLAAMASWPEAKAGHRYADGKWTVREVVGHMADAERIFAIACCASPGRRHAAGRVRRERLPAVAGFEQRTLASVVAELRAIRQSHAAAHPLARRRLTRTRGHGQRQAATVRGMVWVIAGHFQHHADILAQRYGM